MRRSSPKDDSMGQSEVIREIMSYFLYFFYQCFHIVKHFFLTARAGFSSVIQQAQEQ
jgi:hypothetical protein